MEKTTTLYVFSVLLVFLLLVIDVLANTIATATLNAGNTNYIKTSCGTTRYPALCNRYISPYTSAVGSDPWILQEVALSISPQDASNASSLANRISRWKGLSKTEASIVDDCVENIGSSIDEMQRSLQTLKGMVKSSQWSLQTLRGMVKSSQWSLQTLRGMVKLSNSQDRDFQRSKVKTWVSAAITDEYTCTDGSYERDLRSNVNATIRKSMVKVTRLTSNALSLVNSLRY